MARITLLSVLVFAACFHASADEAKPVAFEAQGIVVPARKLTLTGAAAGRVAEVLVEEGQHVKKGEILFRLENHAEIVSLKRTEIQLRIAKLRLDRLRAGGREEALQLAKAELAAGEAGLKFAENSLERIRRLRATGTASAEDLAQAETAFRTAQAAVEKHRAVLKAAERGGADDLELAKLGVEAAQTEAEGARLALDAKEIRAPFDGTMLRVTADPGSYTNPAAIGLAGAATLGELADLSALILEVTLSQELYSHMASGMACEVLMPVQREKPMAGMATAVRLKPLKGTVERVSPAIDPLRSTFTVRVKLATAESIPPGASALVRFPPRQ